MVRGAHVSIRLSDFLLLSWSFERLITRVTGAQTVDPKSSRPQFPILGLASDYLIRIGPPRTFWYLTTVSLRLTPSTSIKTRTLPSLSIDFQWPPFWIRLLFSSLIFYNMPKLCALPRISRWPHPLSSEHLLWKSDHTAALLCSNQLLAMDVSNVVRSCPRNWKLTLTILGKSKRNLAKASTPSFHQTTLSFTLTPRLDSFVNFLTFVPVLVNILISSELGIIFSVRPIFELSFKTMRLQCIPLSSNNYCRPRKAIFLLEIDMD